MAGAMGVMVGSVVAEAELFLGMFIPMPMEEKEAWAVAVEVLPKLPQETALSLQATVALVV
jgi:hypothetical protein